MNIVELYRRLFAGTYFFILRMENFENYQLNSYFAFRALMMMLFAHVFFIVGLIVMFGSPKLLMNIFANISFLILLYILGWFIFLRNEKYKAFVASYKSNKKGVMKFGMTLNVLMMSVLFISITIRVLG